MLTRSIQYTWIFGINMMIRVGLGGWSAWIVYVLVGIMQVVLVVMGIAFAIRDGNQPRKERITSVPGSYDGSDSFDSRWTLYAPRARTTSTVSHGTRSVRSGVAPDERRPLLGSPVLRQDYRATSGVSHGSKPIADSEDRGVTRADRTRA